VQHFATCHHHHHQITKLSHSINAIAVQRVFPATLFTMQYGPEFEFELRQT
jgi:hypothetical protein